MKVLVTGSTGLIGSEAVRFYCNKGHNVLGIDNNMRKYFFGNEASTDWNRILLEKLYRDNYIHYNIDIRNNNNIEDIFKSYEPDLVIHAASQPSHDWAVKEPFTDFNINAVGTLILLENFRKYCPESVFIFTSTNKVYGDTPNKIKLIENETRYEPIPEDKYYNGINETMSIDNSKHSLFGVSKLSADILTQEYGKYFNLKTGIFRCGCVTGPLHSPSQLHGYLSYLIYCIVHNKKYTIFGYNGKQVRDIIHSYDLVNAFDNFFNNPSKGEVYNMGGSIHSNISILEAKNEIEHILGKKAIMGYEKEPRIGDHIWYISDIMKFRKEYPNWEYKYNIYSIIKEMCNDFIER